MRGVGLATEGPIVLWRRLNTAPPHGGFEGWRDSRKKRNERVDGGGRAFCKKMASEGRG